MIGREFNLDGGPAAIAYFSVMKNRVRPFQQNRSIAAGSSNGRWPVQPKHLLVINREQRQVGSEVEFLNNWLQEDTLSL